MKTASLANFGMCLQKIANLSALFLLLFFVCISQLQINEGVFFDLIALHEAERLKKIKSVGRLTKQYAIAPAHSYWRLEMPI